MAGVVGSLACVLLRTRLVSGQFYLYVLCRRIAEELLLWIRMQPGR